VALEMDLVAIDSFDAERIFVAVDDKVIYTTLPVTTSTHPDGSFECGAEESDPDGQSKPWFRDTKKFLRIVLPHSTPDMTIVVFTNLNTAANDGTPKWDLY
jgi:hypothetical protein